MDIWPEDLPQKDKEEQFKLIYDYIKFHLGMYIATPLVIALLAEPFNVKASPWFQAGLGLMIVIYLISGAHAGLFMGRFINDPWEKDVLAEFESRAFKWLRCKDYFQARKSIDGLSLNSDPEQRSDEGRLPSCITPGQSFDLPFAYHVHSFNAFECSLRCLKALEAL